MIRIHMLLVAFFSLFATYGQQEQDSLVLHTDTEQVLQPRSYTQDLNEKYDGEAFNYTIDQGQAQNILERLLRWLMSLLSDTFGINLPPETLIFMKYLIYVLMGGLVIYLLVKFFVRESFSSIFTKKATTVPDLNLSEEHIEHLDLNGLLKSALAEKDYRSAIRYQYLGVLKMLSQKNIIDWHYEKTNLDYQKEIETPKIKSLFEEVSYLYDYVWYGEQEIDEFSYATAQVRFTRLENMIPQ